MLLLLQPLHWRCAEMRGSPRTECVKNSNTTTPMLLFQIFNDPQLENPGSSPEIIKQW